ncbi:MAG: site-2 protease family protein [Thermoplasmata archaeon]|nr:site-2 protease family protein [Thermoplasmata archaeon]
MPPTGPPTEVERIRAAVAEQFPVYETRVTPTSLILLVHADPATLEPRFDRLRQDLWTKLYVAQIRYEGGEYLVEVVRRPNRRPYGVWVNLILLAGTVVTTITAGAFLWLAYVGGNRLTTTDFLWGGLYFGLPLLAILGFHELAHYLVARHHHVEASLPYFLPVPPPYLLFGTFGAFISLREPIPSKKVLLDIGASGPLAGFAIAVPITLLGMALSAHAPALSVANCGPTILGVNYGNLEFGTSLFWYALGFFVPVAFQNLHPLALAGWVGLLVTAINLLPAGQLDGGHVFRALAGDRARYISWAAFFALFALGFLYQGWFIFAILIFFLGMRHPPPLNDITPLDGKRWGVGVLAAAILISGFVVVPIAQPSGAFGVPSHASTTLTPRNGMADNLTLTVVNQDLIGHGFVFSGSIVSVTASVGGRNQVLNQTALTAFQKNSTWTVFLPNGNETRFVGGYWAAPIGQYTTLDAGDSARLNVTFANLAQQAAVTVAITVSELCTTNGPAPQSYSYMID